MQFVYVIFLNRCLSRIDFSAQVLKEPASELKERPTMGCYITGLYLEGARWGYSQHELAESRAKELYTNMPVIWLKPSANRVKPKTGIYDCPVYKTLTRAGMYVRVLYELF